ncbi:MAG: glycogen debranching enzyme N-terminal domain-containing protein, partial [Candidatus Hydrogenedentes bacterium]|nr:glycogen debranching enzyme N-terminal domain-containing protein [Candidatus Hydrogenedentota bacterium]
WKATREFIECRPFEGGPTLYIAHPNACVETIGMWYRGFLYERDRESLVDCIEDLFHPGSLTLTLTPGVPCALVFSSPSPRGISLADEYVQTERRRREALVHAPDVPRDPLWAALLRAADVFVYERLDGTKSIMPGLPWGEAERYRGLIAFAGLLLAPKRFELARQYLEGIAAAWRAAMSPTRFEPEPVAGQMHPADAPLWIFIAAWRFRKATGDKAFCGDMLTPLLSDIAQYYMEGGEARCTRPGFVEVGHEPGADYAPHGPLGTNALWYNAQRILAEFLAPHNKAEAGAWRNRAEKMRLDFNAMFACELRPGLADTVVLEPFSRDETLHASQILAAGLPFVIAERPEAVVECVTQDLLTPVGLRTLSPRDARYVGDGADIRFLPKCWSGSVDPLWLGCYWDAVSRLKGLIDATTAFAAFEMDMKVRGLGHISGAFTGDSPHQPCDYLASAAPTGEIMRLYAREALQFPHVV